MLRTTRIFSALSLSTLAILATLSLGGSARAEEKLYEIRKTDAKVAVGGKATASVTIATKNGWHVNGEAPITLSLTPPPGITLPKTKLARADLAASTQESARFDVAFEAAEPGSKVIAAEARFVICQETACKPVKETLSLTVDVAAPAPAPKAKKAKTKRS
jgi:DsbC/DsbD-like thiol-disulfide interchange protein